MRLLQDRLLLMPIDRDHFRKLAAEALGTSAVVLMGCGAAALSSRLPGSLPGGAVPLIFGLTVATMIYALGHVSGAHFNPAVTLAFALVGRFPRREIPGYVAAQVIGAVLAAALLSALLPPGSGLGSVTTIVSTPVTLAWEGLLTYFLMLVIAAVATDARAIGAMAGSAIGAFVAVGAFLGGPLTGAAMNPARALAPMLFTGDWTQAWIYLIGPTVGAGLAALTYEWVRCDASSGRSSKGCC